MARRQASHQESSTAPRLGQISRGAVLGLLPRGVAEHGYELYRQRKVTRVVWTGAEVEGSLTGPGCSVTVSDQSGEGRLSSSCSSCGGGAAPCAHATAALLQWLDIRPTMLRLGPGAAWRSHSRHPFVSPSRTAAERVDLSHLTGADLRSALELQLSLHRTGSAKARLNGNEVEIKVTLPSGDQREVFFSAAVLPSALPLLRSLPRLELEDELGALELSEARLHPVLTATWNDQGIMLEPGYRLADGTHLSMDELTGRIHGRWAHVGNRLCLLLDPATPLVPFHRRGRQVLRGRDALRYLNLDHPQLLQHPWYRPLGHLASFRQPLEPKPAALEATLSRSGKIQLRPRFTVGDQELGWQEAAHLLAAGFSRVGDAIVRAPELFAFENAGFRLARRGPEHGLEGNRLAFVRLVAETRLPVVAGDEELLHLASLLLGTTAPDAPEPVGLRSVLRPYQRQGVAWLWSRCMARIGALLADDMGLGKTHQVMGLLCIIRARRPGARFLVVCPRGVLDHWLDLLATFAPDLNVRTFHGPTRSLTQPLSDGAVVLTTYDIIFRSTAELQAQEWEVAVFDEAQRIKNPRTKAARAARRIPAAFRVALTGTPLENRLLDLWSVVDLILPGYLGSQREFRTTYRSPSQQQLRRLRERLSVLTLRRLKEQVLSDLPDKVEDLRFCPMSPEQQQLYETIHRQHTPTITEQLRDLDADIPYMHVFALLTRLKQVCDHPALMAPELAVDGASGKLEVCDEILDEALASNHQIVVFSQYVTMIELLRRHLTARRISTLVLTGETRDRGRVIRRFNAGQHERVLLASLLAGGVGIDLTGASVVIHYDRWWNPAKEDQATDRVHRIGQKRFVQVFKLITRGSIEERIDHLIRAKTALLEEVVAPTDDVIRSLGRHELAQLLDINLESDVAS